MVDYLAGISWFALIFVIGVGLSFLASKLKLPNVLFLVALGIFIKYIGVVDIKNIIPIGILTSFSIFALIIIIFDSSSRFKLGEIKRLSPYAAKLSILFLFLNMIFFTIIIFSMLYGWSANLKLLLIAAMFAALMCGTSPDVIMSAIGKVKNKLLEILQFESIINTPLTVLIPLVIFNFYQGVLEYKTFPVEFLDQIMSGVGTGLVIGLLIFHLLNKEGMEKIASLMIIATAVGTYALAEYLGGNGILAITTLGVVFGRVYIKEKLELEKFVDLFANFLIIVVFILLGMLISIPLKLDFFITSGILFIVYLAIRYLSVDSIFRKSYLNYKEKLFMTLNVPKGITVAVVLLILTTYNLKILEPILSLSFAFIIYSIVLSSISIFFINKFIRLKEPGKGIKIRK